MHDKLTDCDLDSVYSCIKALQSKLFSPYKEVILMKRILNKSLVSKKTRNVVSVETNRLCHSYNKYKNIEPLRAYLDDFVMPLSNLWEGGSLEERVKINISPLDIHMLLKELGRDRVVMILSVLFMN